MVGGLVRTVAGTVAGAARACDVTRRLWAGRTGPAVGWDEQLTSDADVSD